MYARFVKLNPDTDITYSYFCYILEKFNKKMVDKILEGKTVYLLNGMGNLRIRKIQRNYSKKMVNFGETNKNRAKGIDKIVYFTDDIYYRFYWEKGKSTCPNKSVYVFKPTRGSNGITQRIGQTLRADEFAHQNFNY